MAVTHARVLLKSWSPRVHPPPPRPVRDDLDPARATKRSDPPRWALMMMRRRELRRLATFVAALLCLALIVAVSGVRVARGSAGTVGVVRNGGPLDARTIRQIIMPGQSLTYTGLFSQAPHVYPASHVTLKYTVASARTARPQPAVDTIVLPTKDGVQVGIDAAVFFRFIGESDLTTLELFDKSVGTRRFETSNDERLFPWQEDEGFGAMLDSLFRPVLENDLRKEVGALPCASLVSSCALVRGGVVRQAAVPSENISGIEARINDSLENDLAQALGHRFFMDIRFRVGRVTLPKNVQQAVDEAQAEFAAVNSAQAELRQARYLARRNRLLGDTYNRSPGLAAIEALKAIPHGSTVIMSPGGRAPTILAGTGGAEGGGTAGGAADTGGAGGDGSDSVAGGGGGG
jgi:regulator of protease activity HflC (stomatin/prohibitin superfamily)